MDWVFHLKIQFQPGHETNPRSHHHRKRCDFRIILSKDSTYRGGDNKINVNINLELERFSETASANAGKKKSGEKHEENTTKNCHFLWAASDFWTSPTCNSWELLLSRKKMIWASRSQLQKGTRHTNNESFLIKCAQSVGPWDGMKTQQITSTKQKDVHPGKLTWNLKITCFRRKTIFQTFIVRFHVNFQGCKKPWLESGIDFFSAPSFLPRSS